MGVGSSRDGLFDSITRRPDCCREAHCGSVCSRPPAPPPDFSLLTFSTFAPSGSDTELKVLLVSLLLLWFLRLCAPCCSISALPSFTVYWLTGSSRKVKIWLICVTGGFIDPLLVIYQQLFDRQACWMNVCPLVGLFTDAASEWVTSLLIDRVWKWVFMQKFHAWQRMAHSTCVWPTYQGVGHSIYLWPEVYAKQADHNWRGCFFCFFFTLCCQCQHFSYRCCFVFTQ